MDNATALQEFERSLRRRFPDRSTPVHYVTTDYNLGRRSD